MEVLQLGKISSHAKVEVVGMGMTLKTTVSRLTHLMCLLNSFRVRDSESFFFTISAVFAPSSRFAVSCLFTASCGLTQSSVFTISSKFNSIFVVSSSRSDVDIGSTNTSDCLAYDESCQCVECEAGYTVSGSSCDLCIESIPGCGLWDTRSRQCLECRSGSRIMNANDAQFCFPDVTVFRRVRKLSTL